jgi:hypothetical protein
VEPRARRGDALAERGVAEAEGERGGVDGREAVEQHGLGGDVRDPGGDGDAEQADQRRGAPLDREHRMNVGPAGDARDDEAGAVQRGGERDGVRGDGGGPAERGEREPRREGGERDQRRRAAHVSRRGRRAARRG